MGMAEELLKSMLLSRTKEMSNVDKANVVKSAIMERLPMLYAQDTTRIQAYTAYKAIKTWFEKNTLEQNQTLVCRVIAQHTDLETLYDEKYRECRYDVYPINDLELYKIVERIPTDPAPVLSLMGQNEYEFDEYFITKGLDRRIVFLSDKCTDNYNVLVLIKGDKAEYEYDKMKGQFVQFDEYHRRASTTPIIAYYMGRVMKEYEIDYAPFYTDDMIIQSFAKYFDRKVNS